MMSGIASLLGTIIGLGLCVGVVVVPIYLWMKYRAQRSTAPSKGNIRREQGLIRDADRRQAIYNAARDAEDARNARRNPPAPPETGLPDPRVK
jgi:hypothetical protein